jgi:hypothetical protein
MDFYTPIFSKIVDSSLWSEPDYVVKVFLTMLAKKDKDFVVRGNAYNISQWAKKTEEETIKALKILAAPDTQRIEKQPFEGRRIEKVEDGWLLLNGRHYQELMTKTNRRIYKAAKQSEYRARHGASPSEPPQHQINENGERI